MAANGGRLDPGAVSLHGHRASYAIFGQPEGACRADLRKALTQYAGLLARDSDPGRPPAS